MNSENLNLLKYRIYNRMSSVSMKLKERSAIFIAWVLPRRVAGWAFVRVATENYDGNPGEQKVSDVINRWIRSTPP